MVPLSSLALAQHESTKIDLGPQLPLFADDTISQIRLNYPSGRNACQ